MPRIVRTEHMYEVDADRLWRSCVSYTCLAETMASLMIYEGLPQSEMCVGQDFEVIVKHHNPLLPTTPWRISILERDDTRHVLRTSESGGFVKSYLHTLTVDEMGEGVSRLVDHVEFDAGWRSRPMSLWIRHIYSSRDKPRRRLLGLNP